MTLRVVDDLNIEASGAVVAHSDGDVVLRAESDLIIGEGAASALDLRGLRAAGTMWLSTRGSLQVSGASTWTHLQAGGDIGLEAQGLTGTGGGSIRSSTGALRVDLGDQGVLRNGSTWLPGVLTVSAKGEVNIQEQTGTLWLASVTSQDHVRLQALAGDIRASGRVEHELTTHVSALEAVLVAGDGVNINGTRNLGTTERALRLDVDQVQLQTFTALRSVINVLAVGDLGLDTGAVSVLRGGIVRIEAQGQLRVDSDVVLDADEGSQVRLKAGGQLRLSGDISFGQGLLELSGASIWQGAGSVVSNPGGAIQVTTTVGDFEQAQGARMASGGAAIGFNVARDLKVSLIDAASGVLTLNVGGSVLESGDDADADLIAGRLVITAGASVGTLGRRGNALEVQVPQLSVSAGGEVALRSLSAVNLKSLQAGLSDAASSAVLVAQGALSVSGAVSTRGGNLLLQATGPQGQLNLNAALATAGGQLSLLSEGAMAMGAALSTAGGSADLQAGGALTMGANASIVTDRSEGTDGRVRLASGGALSVAGIDAGSAEVSLLAAAGLTMAQGTAVIKAWALRASAGAAVGDANNRLRTQVAKASAMAGSGAIALSNTGDLVISSLEDFSIQRVVSTGRTATVWDLERSGMQASGDILVHASGVLTVQGDAVLDEGRTLRAGGSLTLTQGSGTVSWSLAPTSFTATATIGAQARLLTLRTASLEASSAGSSWLANQTSLVIAGGGLMVSGTSSRLMLDVRGDLSLKAAVRAVSGAMTLMSRGDFTQNAIVQSQGGLIEMFSVRGSIIQSATAELASGNGNVLLDAASALALARVNAGTGTVGLVARSGSITDADSGTDDLDISAGRLLMQAGEDMGARVLAGGVPDTAGAQALCAHC